MKFLCNRIRNKYGIDAMREKWIEELIELMLILQQSKSKHINLFDLADEVADVEIICAQIKQVKDISQIVNRRKAQKLRELPQKLDL